MNTLARIRRTDEFVTCDWVAIVHTAYDAPSRNDAMLIGTNTRSGLKMVMTFSRIRKNRSPSEPRWIFEWPAREPASTGSNLTL